MKDVTETYINPVYAGREELRSMGASYLEVEPSGDMLSPHAEPGASLCNHILLCSMLYETPALHPCTTVQSLRLGASNTGPLPFGHCDPVAARTTPQHAHINMFCGHSS